MSELTALYLEEDSRNTFHSTAGIPTADPHGGLRHTHPNSRSHLWLASFATDHTLWLASFAKTAGVGDRESNRFDTLVLNVGLLTTLGSSPGLDEVMAWKLAKVCVPTECPVYTHRKYDIRL